MILPRVILYVGHSAMARAFAERNRLPFQARKSPDRPQVICVERPEHMRGYSNHGGKRDVMIYWNSDYMRYLCDRRIDDLDHMNALAKAHSLVTWEEWMFGERT